jgi:hypothetical protein
MTESKQKVENEALMLWLVMCNISFNSIYNDEFKYFVNTLH